MLSGFLPDPQGRRGRAPGLRRAEWLLRGMCPSHCASSCVHRGELAPGEGRTGIWELGSREGSSLPEATGRVEAELVFKAKPISFRIMLPFQHRVPLSKRN